MFGPHWMASTRREGHPSPKKLGRGASLIKVFRYYDGRRSVEHAEQFLMPISSLIFLICCSLLFPQTVKTGSASEASAPDLILNGDFTKLFQAAPAEWGAHEGISHRRVDARHLHCLQTFLAFPQDAFASQYLPLDGRRIQQVRFGVEAAWKRVQGGRGPANTCRAALYFFDAHGSPLNESVDLGTWTGTRDWQNYEREFPVPPNTRRIQITLGLNGCQGTAWFANARLQVTRGDQTYHTPPDSRTDTRGWFEWGSGGRQGDKEIGRGGDRERGRQGDKENSTAGKSLTPHRNKEGNNFYLSPCLPISPSPYLLVSPTDVSFLLDAPAGRHGFTRAGADGHLVFADGAKARFWGVDMMADACFPSRADAPRIAARLARNGVNIVRLHHIDAPWSDPNVFNPHRDDTQQLDARSLDKLDYFVAQLRKSGIYVYLDLLTNRHFKAGDRVQDGVAIEDGLKIVAHFDPRIKRLHKKYIRQLLTHVNPYTRLRWLDDPALALMEVINEDSLLYEDWYYRVPPAYMRDLQRLCRHIDPRADPKREPFDAPTKHALYVLECGYYGEMRAYLRKLGVRCATTGSNHWEDLGVALRADAREDYIDRHFYWDHPEGGFGSFQKFDNTPMLTNPLDNGLVPLLSQMRVAGKPFIVTEWCFCWPNDHIAEGPLIGTLAACQQDWDVMIWFDFTGADWADTIDNEFDLGNKPHVFAQWPACALMFYRRDVAPLPNVLTASASDADLFAGRTLNDGFPLDAAFTHRLQTRMGEARSQPASPLPFASSGDVWKTDQSQWDAQKGVLAVNTPRSVALVGFTGGQTVTLGPITFAPTTEFSALLLASLDGQPIADSRHLLLTATARAENTGMIMNSGRTSVTHPGRAPIRVEPVRGDFSLNAGSNWKAYALDEHGRRVQSLSLAISGPQTRLQLGSPPALWIEWIR